MPDDRLIKLEFDTPVASAAEKLFRTIDGGVTSEEQASMEILLDSIRSSKMWPRFLEVMEDQNVRARASFSLIVQSRVWYVPTNRMGTCLISRLRR